MKSFINTVYGFFISVVQIREVSDVFLFAYSYNEFRQSRLPLACLHRTYFVLRHVIPSSPEGLCMVGDTLDDSPYLHMVLCEKDSNFS